MSEKPTVRFNINEYIRVKFSPASLRLWKERAQRMQHALPKMADSFPLEPPVDDAGYYRGQFWSIMYLVAPELQAGHSAFEECLIEFEAPELAREVERRREAEEAIDDMIVSATRYCIGRMSYIVGSCDGWLRKWWPHLGAGTRDVILRDIQAALEQERLGRRSLGHQIDIDTWAALYRDFSPGGKDHVTPFDRQGGSPNG